MVMFYGYFEISVNFNEENRREKFVILISIQHPTYSILIIKDKKPLAFGSCFCYAFLKFHNLQRVYITERKHGKPFNIP